MSITILGYHDQALIEQVNTLATKRAETARAEAEKASLQSSSTDFASALSDAGYSYSSATVLDSVTECPTDLCSIFEEAADTYGVSVNLLTSIARAESNFRTDAVSSAGAVGIMQLMPATAASLGVTNSYDARENIMGGARYIAQLLNKYNGNTALALAAYNAGSSNVDQYGGIPPFTETQNYVQKVLSYLKTEDFSDVKDALSTMLSSGSVNESSFDAFVDLLQSIKSNHGTASAEAADTDTEVTATQEAQSSPEITVTVVNDTNTDSL